MKKYPVKIIALASLGSIDLAAHLVVSRNLVRDLRFEMNVGGAGRNALPVET